MCYNFMSFPNPIGVRISELQPGDEVIILKGEGYPAVQKETCTVIWKVSGYSALTIDGIRLSCNSLTDLIVTGNQFETYQVSPEAIQIWGEVQARKLEEETGKDPDWSVPVNFRSEPE